MTYKSTRNQNSMISWIKSIIRIEDMIIREMENLSCKERNLWYIVSNNVACFSGIQIEF